MSNKNLNWISAALFVTALLLTVFGFRQERFAPLELPHIATATSPEGAPVVVCDDGLVSHAFVRIGLPEPPAFDGSDPVPTNEILNRARIWTDSRSPEVLGEMGMIFLALEENQAALAYLASAYLLDPQEPRWCYFLAAACQKLAYREKAVDLLESFLELEPGYATAHARLGLLNLELDRLEKALFHYQRCRDLQQGQSLGYVGLGRVLLAQNKPEEALANLQKAAQVSGNDFMAFRFLGMALMDVGREQEARIAVARAESLPQYSGWLQFDPKLSQAHELARSQRYLENGLRVAFGSNDLAKAHQIVDQLIERRPGDAAMINNKANLYLKQKKYNQALQLLEQTLANHPQNALLHFNRGRTLFMVRSFPQAEQAINQSLNLEPDNAAAMDLKGRILYRLNRSREAIEVLEQAIVMDPRNTGTQIALAAICVESGNPQRARQLYEAILSTNPNHPQARAGLARLPAP